LVRGTTAHGMIGVSVFIVLFFCTAIAANFLQCTGLPADPSVNSRHFHRIGGEVGTRHHSTWHDRFVPIFIVFFLLDGSRACSPWSGEYRRFTGTFRNGLCTSKSTCRYSCIDQRLVSDFQNFHCTGHCACNIHRTTTPGPSMAPM
jgi:hypothetical protein